MLTKIDSKKSSGFSAQRNFSHIYVEQDAFAYPDTALVLERFKAAEVVEIKHYKDVFNRNKQDWSQQKRSQKMILAVRRDKFLYPGSSVAPAFGNKNFYYNTLIANCVYNCSYCYLQGLYPTANMLMYVNNADYIAATEKLLAEVGPSYLCISYDTDLLACEDILPFNQRWLEYAHRQPDLLIESRTKSSNIRALSKQQPADNFILAWTLSPQSVIDSCEAGTPGLDQRIRAINTMLELGFSIRLCFDPLLAVPDWADVYSDFLNYLAGQTDLQRIRDCSVGVFRTNQEYLKNLRAINSNAILYYPFTTSGNLASYPAEVESGLEGLVRNRLIELGVSEQRINLT
jgi:spore photoproduct lyase